MVYFKWLKKRERNKFGYLCINVIMYFITDVKF